MRYQGFVTERKDPSLELKGEYQAYYVPVQQRDGGWFPAGPANLDAGYDQVDMLSNVLHYQIYRNKEDCGPLDDIASPDGHTVVARYWLEDDYEPPTKEELAARRADAIDYLRSIGVRKDD
jgi:hypothetical protein